MRKSQDFRGTEPGLQAVWSPLFPATPGFDERTFRERTFVPSPKELMNRTQVAYPARTAAGSADPDGGSLELRSDLCASWFD